MASLLHCTLFLQIALLISLSHSSFAMRNPTELVKDPPQQDQLLSYHHGALLYGKITVNLIWYGKFTPTQKAIVSDFISSLSSSPSLKKTAKSLSPPSVSDWWKITEKYHHLASKKNSKIPTLSLSLGEQVEDETCSLGKSLTDAQILKLASKGQQSNAINVVLTAADVAVEDFCMNRCGAHGSSIGSGSARTKTRSKFAYIWVGNSETQCPGLCAWPFHQPLYGPQTKPLIAPNNDVGVDGIVMNLAGLLAGTATNPFGNGFFQGEAGAPLEAASACPGVFGRGSYPGYPGSLRVEPLTGASYNAQGSSGRKYLLPALYDPLRLTCSTLV